jgi:hypothetical protein
MSTAATAFLGREAHAQDNFEPLCSLDWQTHVYGEVDKDLETACRELHLPLHVFT